MIYLLIFTLPSFYCPSFLDTVFITMHHFIINFILYSILLFFIIVLLLYIFTLYVIVFITVEYFIIIYNLKFYVRAIAQGCSQRRKTHSLIIIVLDVAVVVFPTTPPPIPPIACQRLSMLTDLGPLNISDLLFSISMYMYYVNNHACIHILRHSLKCQIFIKRNRQPQNWQELPKSIYDLDLISSLCNAKFSNKKTV